MDGVSRMALLQTGRSGAAARWSRSPRTAPGLHGVMTPRVPSRQYTSTAGPTSESVGIAAPPVPLGRQPGRIGTTRHGDYSRARRPGGLVGHPRGTPYLGGDGLRGTRVAGARIGRRPAGSVRQGWVFRFRAYSQAGIRPGGIRGGASLEGLQPRRVGGTSDGRSCEPLRSGLPLGFFSRFDLLQMDGAPPDRSLHFDQIFP